MLAILKFKDDKTESTQFSFIKACSFALEYVGIHGRMSSTKGLLKT